MDKITGRPNHIEDYLSKLNSGQWFGWSNSKEKVYANLIVHPKIWDNSYEGNIHEEGMIDNPYSKPTEQECIDGLAALQTAWDDKKAKRAADKTSGNTKLQNLGLTADEISALTKG